MSHKKQRGHMWGCWVVWSGGKDEGWMWDSSAKDAEENLRYCPMVFTERRRGIMPLVRDARRLGTIKSAKAVKVPIPEPPDA